MLASNTLRLLTLNMVLDYQGINRELKCQAWSGVQWCTAGCKYL